MYTQVASKLVATQAADEFSQAAGMAGGNAVFAEVTAFTVSLSGGTSPKLVVVLEGSNDLQNWSLLSDMGSAGEFVEMAAPGYGRLQVESIAAAYVRLKFTYSGSPSAATSVAAAGINVANL